MTLFSTMDIATSDLSVYQTWLMLHTNIPLILQESAKTQLSYLKGSKKLYIFSRVNFHDKTLAFGFGHKKKTFSVLTIHWEILRLKVIEWNFSSRYWSYNIDSSKVFFFQTDKIFIRILSTCLRTTVTSRDQLNFSNKLKRTYRSTIFS